jgi:hypothetical protein
MIPFAYQMAALAAVAALMIVTSVIYLYKDAVIGFQSRLSEALGDYDFLSAMLIALAGPPEEDEEEDEEDEEDTLLLGISSEPHDFLGIDKASYARAVLRFGMISGAFVGLLILLLGASVLVSAMLGLMAFGIVWALVPLMERDRINQRMAEQVRLFPFFLDIFLLMHQSNGDIQDAIKSYRDIFGNDDLSQELAVLSEDLKSHSMEDSFDRLRHRVGSEQLQNILGDLVQKLRTGADLGMALEQQAEDMRHLRQQLAAAAAERLNAKFNIPVVLAALATLLIFLSPAVAMMTASGFL